jgi:hypothetical protein
MNPVSAASIRAAIVLALTCVGFIPAVSVAQTDAADEETAFYRNNHYIPIKGEQDSDYPRGVYCVTDDVVIKKGKTMTLMPGTLVLLKKDTRITVEGRLICQGSRAAAITFARLANDKYLIPLDPSVDARWDGIFVADSGSVEISFTNITGSKYGLENTQASGAIILDTVLFKDNKFQNLKVAGNLICVPENKSIFYSSRMSAANAGGHVSPETKKQTNWKPTLRIGFGALALAGAVLYAAEFSQAADYQKKSNDAITSDDAKAYDKKANDDAKMGNIGGIIGILGAIGFTVTFLF